MGRFKPGLQLSQCLLFVAGVSMVNGGAFGASFTERLFAFQPIGSGTEPDAVASGDGSIWVAYENGAPTRSYSGAGTITQYNLSGAVMNSYPLAGSLLGLKYNPSTGSYWVLQGQDAFSQLSVINPSTKGISSYAFQGSFDPGVRTFNDVAFAGGNVFVSEYPSSIVKLDNPNPSGPLTFATVLSRGVPDITPAFLDSTPSGGLILSNRDSRSLTFVSSPGQASQSVRTLQLIASAGTVIGSPGDALYATAPSGTFYLTERQTNRIDAVSATGLDPNTLFVNVGDAFGTVDTTTGIVTPILYGGDLEGMTFVPDANTAVPEPTTLGMGLAGLVLGSLTMVRERARK